MESLQEIQKIEEGGKNKGLQSDLYNPIIVYLNVLIHLLFSLEYSCGVGEALLFCVHRAPMGEPGPAHLQWLSVSVQENGLGTQSPLSE